MMIDIKKRGIFVSILALAWIGFGAVGIATGELVYQDDFEAYDIENPSDFSVGGTSSGNWIAGNTSTDATRIFDSPNFAGSRLWISNVDGTTITNEGIVLTGNSDYRFSVALLSETYDQSRQLEATYDLKIGPDAGSATSVIGGPRTVVTHGDNWQLDNSKEDHFFTHDFSTGSLNPGDKLFILITRVGVYAGTGAWFGVDDVRVQRRTVTYDSAYYVDSFAGDDTNNGTSPQEAWASLSHVNSQTFVPGDHLLFRTGTVYVGQFKPQGSGASGNPIVVDIYGNGPKPRIDGQGTVLEAVLLDNVEYYRSE
jgi:hypothetical protein